MAVVKRRQAPSVMGKAMTRENQENDVDGKDYEEISCENKIVLKQCKAEAGWLSRNRRNPFLGSYFTLKTYVWICYNFHNDEKEKEV